MSILADAFLVLFLMYMSFFSFISSLSTSGSIAPYTKGSIQRILQSIDRSKDQKIVEYGPGTGNITREILARMSSRSTLTCFELNTDFDRYLSTIQDSRCTIHYDSCESVDIFFGQQSIDCVISTIPFTLIDKDVRDRIMQKTYDMLKPGGICIGGQYANTMHSVMQKYFQTKHYRYRRSLPPIRISVGQKTETITPSGG